MKQQKPIYSRILLKLSGEALLGGQAFGVDPQSFTRISQDIEEIVELGVEVGIVIGGGNLFRGEKLAQAGFDRITCDQMGMLATVMNGLILCDSFLKDEIPARVMSSIAIPGIAEGYDRKEAIAHLKDGQVVIFAGGTGNPLFSTDSAASLRGIEIGADIILKATKVDGVYSEDPEQVPNAQRFDRLSYQEVLERQLRVMDAAAICLCRDYNMPLRVFDMNKPGILKSIIMGENEGALISD